MDRTENRLLRVVKHKCRSLQRLQGLHQWRFSKLGWVLSDLLFLLSEPHLKHPTPGWTVDPWCTLVSSLASGSIFVCSWLGSRGGPWPSFTSCHVCHAWLSPHYQYPTLPTVFRPCETSPCQRGVGLCWGHPQLLAHWPSESSIFSKTCSQAGSHELWNLENCLSWILRTETEKSHCCQTLLAQMAGVCVKKINVCKSPFLLFFRLPFFKCVGNHF